MANKESTRKEIRCHRNENATLDVWDNKKRERERERNVRVRGTTKVVEISTKIKERRLQSHRHVMRRTNDYVVRSVMAMEVEGKRGRGRPRRKWMDTVKMDLGGKGLSGKEVQDRVFWRSLIRNVEPT